MTNFDRIQEMIDKVNQSNSNNDKLEALKDFSDLKEILHLVYSPYTQFHVSSANLKKRKDLISHEYSSLDFSELLRKLVKNEISGHKALSEVNGFIENNPQHVDLIYNIIDKNLKTRMDVKSINKVFPDLIPTFSVALANKFDDKMAEKINFEKEIYYASHKLDGCRCIARKEGNEVTFFSRNGKEFWTLDKVKESILSVFPDQDIVLDGEICLLDKDGNEDFQNVMKEIRKKNHRIENPLFNVFDFLTTKEFDNKKSSVFLKERLDSLPEAIYNTPFIKVIDQIRVTNSDHLAELTKMAEDKGWEGLILRKNAPYQGKRSNDLLKVKKFHDAEYVVEDVEFGPIRYIANGLDVEEEMLSRVFITHKGFRVRVGSGFSIEERKSFYEDPSKIIGKTITVKFFEESKNQSGELSLRFPTVKVIHGKERTT